MHHISVNYTYCQLVIIYRCQTENKMEISLFFIKQNTDQRYLSWFSE